MTTHTHHEVTKRIIMCHCGQLLFLSSNDRPVQSLHLAASLAHLAAILFRIFARHVMISIARSRPFSRLMRGMGGGGGAGGVGKGSSVFRRLFSYSALCSFQQVNKNRGVVESLGFCRIQVER